MMLCVTIKDKMILVMEIFATGCVRYSYQHDFSLLLEQGKHGVEQSVDPFFFLYSLRLFYFMNLCAHTL